MGLVRSPGTGIQTGTVVAHLDDPLRRRPHVDPFLACTGMLAGLGQRLLQRMQHMDLYIRRQGQALAIRLHVRGQPLWC